MRVDRALAIVTGAARGLGRCFALELAREGAQVMACDVDRAGLRQLLDEARDLPGRLLAAPVDITEDAAVDRFVETAAERLGGLNALVNNAGILRDGLLVEREGEGIRRLPAELWRRVLDVDLTGQFLMTRAFAAEVLRRNPMGAAADAVIVNISSLARAGNPGQSSYAAAKAGLDASTRTWARELARHGIRVGGVAPGVIDTPILENISEEALETLRGGIPLGRFGTPEEVWQGVRFVLECEFFTGRTIEIDGGSSLG